MKRKLLLLFTAILLSSTARGEWFFETDDWVDGIYYHMYEGYDATGTTWECYAIVINPAQDEDDPDPPNYEGDIVIPSTVSFEGMTFPVIAIGDRAFLYNQGLDPIEAGGGYTPPESPITSVSIPNSVTSIGTAAFCGCNNLTSIVIPSSVTTIGASAFAGCTRLTSVIIPNSVLTIGTNAFNGCSGLTSVILSSKVSDIGDKAFYGCNNLTTVTARGIRPAHITADVFPNRLSQTLYVPKGRKSTYENADYWWQFKYIYETDEIDMTNLMVNPNFTYYEEGWTREATDGGNVTAGGLPNNPCYEAWNNADFDIYQNVRNAPRGVYQISVQGFYRYGRYEFQAFLNGEQYTTKETCPVFVYMNNNATPFTNIYGDPVQITDESFYSSSSGDYGWETLADGTTVYFPNGMQSASIAFGAGMYTQSAYGLLVNDGDVMRIGVKGSSNQLGDSWSIWDNFKITWCSINTDVVKPLLEQAITDAEKLLDDDLSSAVVNELQAAINQGRAVVNGEDGEAMFEALAALYELKDRVRSFIKFADANVKAICVENWDTNGDGELSKDEAASVTTLGQVFNKSHLGNGNNEITSFDELQYFTGLTSINMYAFKENTNLTSVIIPNNVVVIRAQAFDGCISLNSITIPNSVTEIGWYAFKDCQSLTSVTIPSSVIGMEKTPFPGCSGLKSIVVDSENPLFDSRDDCNAIIESSTNVLMTGCKNTIIPNSVTSIGDHAFYGCSGLDEFTIPNSVTNIGEYVFQRCVELNSVTIPSSVTSIGRGAFWACYNLVSFTVEWDNPLELPYNFFDNVPLEQVTLYVPAGTKSAYASDDVWKDFGKIVEYVDLVENGSMEGEQSEDWTSFWVHEWRTMEEQFDGPANIVEDPKDADNHCVKVVVRSEASADAAGNKSVDGEGNFAQWDSQFFIQSREKIESGSRLRLTMRVRADKPATIGTEAHNMPGDYNYWGLFGDIHVTQNWQWVVKEVTISPEMTQEENGKEMHTVAFHLATMSDGDVFYFDDIKLEVMEMDVFEFVDLGLPSGTLWATCNVGASAPEGYGDFYAWGETATKSTYTWANYQHAGGTAASVRDIGADISGTGYDVAFVTGGKDVSMPTKAQWEELRTRCTWKETTENGRKGFKVTASNGNSIFLPLAGCSYDGKDYSKNVSCNYWSSEVSASDAQKANVLYVKTGTAPKMTVAQRRTGVVVRPVKGGRQEERMELVDLGLSVKWCSMNLGAGSESDYGGYYSWGETAPKSTYTWANYQHASGTAASVRDIGADIRATQYDAAYLLSNGAQTTICMPTKAQWEELRTCCTWKEATVDGHKGFRVTASNGNSIFLPLAGCSYDGKDYSQGVSCNYWSSEVSASDAQKANVLYVKTGTSPKMTVAQRRTGAVIRAVEYKESTPPAPVNHDYVDLGLPSGTLWATCNVGAAAPEGYGDFYAWGETSTKTTYSWSNYQFSKGSSSTTKDIGTHIAGTGYDAATAAWGEGWVLPTLDQANELLGKCTASIATVNGVRGVRFKGPNGNTIFFPLTGYMADANHKNESTQCYLWTDTKDIVTNVAYKAMALYLEGASSAASVSTTAAPRRSGVSLRAVKAGAGTPEPTFELVDLGLSVKWCNMNLGAGSESDYGGYYAWGETAPKSTYTWANYQHASGTAASVRDIGADIRATQHDAAYLLSNGAQTTICMPTKAQWEELRTCCTWKEATVDGHKGFRVTASNSNSIFLPLAGCSYDGKDYSQGVSCNYWSSEVSASDAQKANVLYVKTGTSPKMTVAQRRTGAVIRAVEYKESTPPAPVNHDYVDLGLPSGTLWATCNVGAAAPEGYGDFYAWGETSTKATYSWSNYQYCKGSSSSVIDLGTHIAGTVYDAATAAWGDGWVLPTLDQANELVNYCTAYISMVNNVKVLHFKGPNGNNIFFPMTGYMADANHKNEGTQCYLWTDTKDIVTNVAYKAMALYLERGSSTIGMYTTGAPRRSGVSLRAVKAGGASANDHAFDTDGVHTVNTSDASDDATYTLQGVKVEGALKPGIYIRNGKKFVKK